MFTVWSILVFYNFTNWTGILKDYDSVHLKCMYMYVCMYVCLIAGMFGPAFGGLLFKINPLLPICTVVFIYFTVFMAVWAFYRPTIIQYNPTSKQQPDLTALNAKSDKSISKNNNMDVADSGEITESTASSVSGEDSDVDLTGDSRHPLKNYDTTSMKLGPELKEKKDL